jgi:hypothetical protein
MVRRGSFSMWFRRKALKLFLQARQVGFPSPDANLADVLFRPRSQRRIRFRSIRRGDDPIKSLSSPTTAQNKLECCPRSVFSKRYSRVLISRSLALTKFRAVCWLTPHLCIWKVWNKFARLKRSSLFSLRACDVKKDLQHCCQVVRKYPLVFALFEQNNGSTTFISEKVSLRLSGSFILMWLSRFVLSNEVA